MPANKIEVIPKTTPDVTFAVFGDFRTLRRDRPYGQALMQMLHEIDMISPSFIMSTGDAYYGYGGSLQRFKNEVDYFMATVKPLDTPFLNVIGNHETAGSMERESYIKERFGNLYGSFDSGNSHFIVLNTEEPDREGTVSHQQLEWLEKDLDANKGADNIFVFMHRPLFSALDPELITGKSFKDKANRDYLHSLFMKYRIKAVFAGHEHLLKNTLRDGIRYIITGGGGAPFYQSPSKGGFFHYMLISVKGKDITIEDMEPYNFHVRNISGNDGFEQKAEVEVSNTSYTTVELRNLSLNLPLASPDRYRVKALSISAKGNISEHPARAGRVKDNGNGTAAVSVETSLPANGLIRVIVEVDI